jgi:hypothetical protein
MQRFIVPPLIFLSGACGDRDVAGPKRPLSYDRSR